MTQKQKDVIMKIHKVLKESGLTVFEIIQILDNLFICVLTFWDRSLETKINLLEWLCKENLKILKKNSKPKKDK